jgi:alpha-L-fucosidase 2
MIEVGTVQKTQALNINIMSFWFAFVVFVMLSFSSMIRSQTDTPLDKYNVVWESASQKEADSMPTGNGDIGLNVWVEPGSDLLFYIGKTDSWSENARLLKLGRVRVKLSPNPFGKDMKFRQELKLLESEVVISAGPENRQVVMRVWVDAHNPVIHVEAAGEKAFDMQVSLETWRNEAHELEQYTVSDIHNNLYGDRLYKTIVKPDVLVKRQKDRITWYHDNGQSEAVSIGMKLQGFEGFIDKMEDPISNRIWGGTIKGKGLVSIDERTLKSARAQNNQSVSIFVLTQHPATPEQWLGELDKIVKEVGNTSIRKSRTRHQKWWSDFWDRSWIHLSGPQDAETVGKGYTLFRYMLACSGRGAQPIKFNGSIFTWNHGNDPDYRMWGGGYWYQNQRLFYWPMMATGDFDLIQPHFMMYRNALDLAKYRTQRYFGHGGAFYPETMYFWGAETNDHYGWTEQDKRESILAECKFVTYYWQNSLEQIAMMLDYYYYTEDKDFARKVLLPMVDAVIEFYDVHYKRDDNGKIRFTPAQSLETWWDSVNPMPEIAGLKFNLTKLLALPENVTAKNQRSKWKRILGELPAVPTRKVDGKTVLAAADSFADKNNIENPELYAVFPYRLYGMGKEGLDIARGAFENRLHIEGNHGHDQDDAHSAYLGLTSTVREMITRRMGSKYQTSRFPAFWHGGYDWPPDYCHGGNGMIAIHAMLMQCEDKKILLFPAWPKEWDVDFKLHAPYKTTVEGVYRDGRLKKLKVTPKSRGKDVVDMTAK